MIVPSSYRAANQRRDAEDPSGDEERGDAHIGHTP